MCIKCYRRTRHLNLTDHEKTMFEVMAKQELGRIPVPLFAENALNYYLDGQVYLEEQRRTFRHRYDRPKHKPNYREEVNLHDYR